jgi:hypothetical protein
MRAIPRLSLRARRVSWLSLAFLAVLAFAPAPAGAVPLYFTGSNTGFSPTAVQAAGLSPLYLSNPSGDWHTAGDTRFLPDVSVVEISRTVLSNPQGRGDIPDFDDPALVNVRFRITNRLGEALTNPLLVFLGASVGSRDPDIDRVGLEVDLLDAILKYEGGTPDPLLYGVLQLPTLQPGEFVERTIRYVIADAMRVQGGNAVVPPYTVAVLNDPTVIPEPTTLLLASVACASLLAARRWAR